MGTQGHASYPFGFTCWDEQRRVYERLDEDMVAQLSPKRRVTAGLTITQIAKLQQLTSGWVNDDDGDAYDVGRGKLRKLKTLLRELQPPMVVFCRYKRDIDLVVEAGE